MSEFFSNSTVQGFIGTSLLLLLAEGLRRLIRIEGIAKEVVEIKNWKLMMDKKLETEFVRKEVLELHMRNMSAMSTRIEVSAAETRRTVEDLRNLLTNHLIKDK